MALRRATSLTSKSLPETARRAVDFAIKRSGEQPENARVQRGSRKLVDDIVNQFPKADRAEIFPPAALAD